MAIADSEWKTDNSTVALELLEKADVRSLGAGFRRLVEAKKFALRQTPEIQATLRAYLLQEYSQGEGLIQLSELATKYPTNGLIHYLFARRLEQIGMVERGITETRIALAATLPHRDFRDEANKMLGRMLLEDRQFDAAELQFVKMANTSSRAIDRLEALQWQQRAKIRKELEN